MSWVERNRGNIEREKTGRKKMKDKNERGERRK